MRDLEETLKKEEEEEAAAALRRVEPENSAAGTSGSRGAAAKSARRRRTVTTCSSVRPKTTEQFKSRWISIWANSGLDPANCPNYRQFAEAVDRTLDLPRTVCTPSHMMMIILSLVCKVFIPPAKPPEGDDTITGHK